MSIYDKANDSDASAGGGASASGGQIAVPEWTTESPKSGEAKPLAPGVTPTTSTVLICGQRVGMTQVILGVGTVVLVSVLAYAWWPDQVRTL